MPPGHAFTRGGIRQEFRFFQKNLAHPKFLAKSARSKFAALGITWHEGAKQSCMLPVCERL